MRNRPRTPRLTATQRRHRAEARTGWALCIVAVLGVVALLAADALATRAACSGTHNPAMCELAISAGKPARTAIDQGNGIYAEAR